MVTGQSKVGSGVRALKTGKIKIAVPWGNGKTALNSQGLVDSVYPLSMSVLTFFSYSLSCVQHRTLSQTTP